MANLDQFIINKKIVDKKGLLRGILLSKRKLILQKYVLSWLAITAVSHYLP